MSVNKISPTKILGVRLPVVEVERFRKLAKDDGGHAKVLARYIRRYIRRKQQAA